MEIRVIEYVSSVTILLKGMLNLASGGELKEKVAALLDTNKSNVHLNLAKLEFIDSNGLGSLVSIMNEVRLHKGRLTLSNLSGDVQGIFNLTRLSGSFEIYATEEEALASYQSTKEE